MKTPLTDEAWFWEYFEDDEEKLEFARRLERDIRHLLLRLYMAWEDDPLSFAPESAEVMERWKPEVEKMLKGDA